ncbi:MAG: GNAT family N-acetyltransferase [Proteobacteria bacterium]|nr:GNAT family N-acetyltransferase [Pseudomonadota bacterium]
MNVGPAPAGFALEAATAADFEALLALRLRAMRDSLTRVGRYDEQRARERLAAGFDPAHTRHIVVDGQRVGFIVLKRLTRALRLDHLYIDPPFQRHGIGRRVLDWICAKADHLQLPVELVVLKASDANRFYLRRGFVATGDGDWDIDYLRLPQGPSVQTVREWWHALQARDWARARALLRADLQATWWTSGERFDGADAFIEAQRRYPEGWTVQLLECTRLEDGRVLALLRVDQPPQHFYATSIARVDDGHIIGLEEYWATLEAPPAWRAPPAIAGLGRFDPLDDPRALTP